MTGAASGIGAATAALLRDQGGRVITVDQRDADVVADLSTAEGRAAAVAGVQALTDVVHGLVPAAGIAGLTGVDPELVVSVNYFGALALVEGLRPQLAAAGGAGVVLLASNSTTCQPGWPTEPRRHPPRRGRGRRPEGAPHPRFADIDVCGWHVTPLSILGLGSDGGHANDAFAAKKNRLFLAQQSVKNETICPRYQLGHFLRSNVFSDEYRHSRTSSGVQSDRAALIFIVDALNAGLKPRKPSKTGAAMSLGWCVRLASVYRPAI